mmetsp:Transcript_4977/g.6980  ORF Transcript_4977/g.6980 Transcript_4977/m.6980 type:complete len:99 (-) Transcript_4977:1585-1881(-)
MFWLSSSDSNNCVTTNRNDSKFEVREIKIIAFSVQLSIVRDSRDFRICAVNGMSASSWMICMSAAVAANADRLDIAFSANSRSPADSSALFGIKLTNC